ncbi:hypothetical protein THAOC_23015, partial [Thalassiosira oceanica]
MSKIMDKRPVATSPTIVSPLEKSKKSTLSIPPRDEMPKEYAPRDAHVQRVHARLRAVPGRGDAPAGYPHEARAGPRHEGAETPSLRAEDEDRRGRRVDLVEVEVPLPPARALGGLVLLRDVALEIP